MLVIAQLQIEVVVDVRSVVYLPAQPVPLVDDHLARVFVDLLLGGRRQIVDQSETQDFGSSATTRRGETPFLLNDRKRKRKALTGARNIHARSYR